MSYSNEVDGPPAISLRMSILRVSNLGLERRSDLISPSRCPRHRHQSDRETESKTIHLQRSREV